MPPKKQTFGLLPLRKKIHLSQSFKKNLFWKGMEFPVLPSLPKKNPFGKIKIKKTPHPLFLKPHLQVVILSI